MKIVLKIVGIIIFFSISAYTLTYPYELSYKGTKDIKLIEESYEYTSLEQIINRSEFKDKVLYIRVWEPLEREICNYSLKEQKKQRDSIIKLIENDTLDKDITTPERIRNNLFLSGKMGIVKDVISFEEELKYLSEMQEDYQSKNIAFVFLTRPVSEFKTKQNDLRKWKAAIKKHKIKGNHFIMSPKLESKLISKIKAIKGNNMVVFPHNFIVDKYKNIVNKNAASPSFEKEILYSELDSILKH
jgi:hypothetical protein